MTKTVVFGAPDFFRNPAMKKTSSFASLSQQLIDVWISQEQVKDPRRLYSPVKDRIAANMVVAVIEKAEDVAGDFRVRFIERYKVPTSLADVRFPLGEEFDANTHPLSSAIANTFASRRPTLVSDRLAVGNLRMEIDLVTLPKKGRAKSSDWCLAFVVIKGIVRKATVLRDLDDIDLSILQLLREGFLSREIGERLARSPRTVEHRLERLKALLDARTLHDLVVRSL